MKDPHAIPATILERNLFGIDIDPRAIPDRVAVADADGEGGCASATGFAARRKVRRSNLVVANAVNLGAERLKQLVDHIGSKLGSPELRERLFKTLWDNLQHVGELGSLVQVREGRPGARRLGRCTRER